MTALRDTEGHPNERIYTTAVMPDNKDIEIAAKQLNENSRRYLKPANYYAGVHDLRFASEKFANTFGKLFREFSLNMCPAVCDSVRDKLTITGFNVESGDSKQSSADAWKIWQMNGMGRRSRQIHREALVSGDAYAIVWIDAQNRTTIFPNRAESCMVVYDTETPGLVLWGAKFWITQPDGRGARHARLNLFYPDRIERYVTAKKCDGVLPTKREEWNEFAPKGSRGFAVVNPYHRVPIFHFGNNADLGSLGTSELKDAIPVQDALNKSVLDMMVAMEFASYRQRWAAGIEIDYDKDGKAIPPFTAGVERLWVTENAESKFGDFEATDLEQFLKVKDGFRTDLATVTGTPLHYFMLTGAAFPQSGISIEKIEARFQSKVKDRMETFGETWESAMSLAMQIEGKGGTRLFADWANPAPLSEQEQLANLMQKQLLNVPDEQLWEEAGYGESDVKRFGELKAAAQENLIKGFNAGESTGEPPVSVGSKGSKK